MKRSISNIYIILLLNLSILETSPAMIYLDRKRLLRRHPCTWATEIRINPRIPNERKFNQIFTHEWYLSVVPISTLPSSSSTRPNTEYRIPKNSIYIYIRQHTLCSSIALYRSHCLGRSGISTSYWVCRLFIVVVVQLLELSVCVCARMVLWSAWNDQRILMRCGHRLIVVPSFTASHRIASHRIISDVSRRRRVLSWPPGCIIRIRTKQAFELGREFVSDKVWWDLFGGAIIGKSRRFHIIGIIKFI